MPKVPPREDDLPPDEGEDDRDDDEFDDANGEDKAPPKPAS